MRVLVPIISLFDTAQRTHPLLPNAWDHAGVGGPPSEGPQPRPGTDYECRSKGVDSTPASGNKNRAVDEQFFSQPFRISGANGNNVAHIRRAGQPRSGPALSFGIL